MCTLALHARLIKTPVKSKKFLDTTVRDMPLYYHWFLMEIYEPFFSLAVDRDPIVMDFNGLRCELSKTSAVKRFSICLNTHVKKADLHCTTGYILYVEMGYIASIDCLQVVLVEFTFMFC